MPFITPLKLPAIAMEPNLTLLPNLTDFLLVPLHAGVLVLLAWVLVRKRYTGAMQRLFWLGFAIHLAAGVGVGLAHEYWYPHQNDSEAYWLAARQLWAAMVQHPDEAPAVLFRWFAEGDAGQYPAAFRAIGFFEDHRAFNFVRLVVLLVPVTGGSYYALGLYLSAVGFTGSWALFKVLTNLAPSITNWLAAVWLFWPSLTFWTSGVLKEPWVFGMLGLMVWAGYRLLLGPTIRWQWVLALSLGSLLGYLVKPYPVLAWWACAPIAVAGLRLTPAFWRQHRAQALGLLAGVVLLSVGILTLSPFNLERVFAEVFYLREVLINAYTPQALQATSYFELTDYTPTLVWALSKFPQATFATLFRPLLWEAHNTQAWLAACENVMLLAAVLYCLATTRYRQLLRVPRPKLTVVICLLAFSIPYAYFLGLATPFFGTLIRYKVYVLPFFVSGVLLLRHFSRTYTQPTL